MSIELENKEYVLLLNALVDMQRSDLYKIRKQTLLNAEIAIVSLQDRLRAAEANYETATHQVSKLDGDYEAAMHRVSQLEAELQKAREQEPIAWMNNQGETTINEIQVEYWRMGGYEITPLYAAPVPAQQVQDEPETNHCALKSIDDSQVSKVVRAFWRRIYAYRNDYGIELPNPLPVEFMAHMATALSWVDKDTQSAVPSDNQAKADLIMDFVGIMIGAFDSGFVDTARLNLAQLYQVARNHVKDNFGIDTKSLAEEMGDDFARCCNPKLRGAVPDGYRLVPVEPTDEMLNAAWEVDIECHNCESQPSTMPLGDFKAKECYQAMLSAAPEVK